MQIDLERSRQYLKQFQFQPLFVEELGWDNYPSQPLPLLIENKSYTLKPVAEKRGQVVYTCVAEDGAIPNSVTRTKIHKEVSRYSLENVLIYIDQGETEQVWQWVRRDPGKPKANRFHQFHKSQSGDALLQKLEALAVSFDEEEGLTLVDVTSRTRRAFDVDRITKKFYERFKKEHGLFLKFIAGIRSQFDQEWYCSLMLNRLMFVYFIQKKGFLDGNTNYLRDRLQSCQSLKGQDSFHSFYRYFLLKLFHSGLGDPKRTPELDQLLGKVPYLNGGLFEVHQLEETYPDIQIPDQAFEKVFDFFDEYQWHLDDRPLHNDREINPDVLGYIFEKYINQKQMGAYYTKEDITEYISKNTIIPFLFNAAEKACSIAFQRDGSVWRLLKDNPDRYIYAAMQKGVDLPLPDAIASGIPDISQRQGWNRPADSAYALPTETWREHITRRQRCLELRQKLADGEVHSIDDLITLNLNMRQFAQDVIENCEGSELLRAFYNAICQVSILDPTCGSGAFLFAALNILDPLYDACLERMQVFLDDLKRSDHPHHPEAFGDFRQILDRVAQHPNRRYFILKSIILNNLYGVDIMEEATEICKLRLFLKLVSQVEPDSYAANYGLEPLPDIDFNIRAGNTLIGFASYEEVKKAVEGDQQKELDLFGNLARLDESAAKADAAFQEFRKMQTEYTVNSQEFRAAKSNLKNQLQELNKQLNIYLAESYEIGLSNKSQEYEKWLNEHQPFHWFIEFYSILKNGGFDIAIGNPPYVEVPKSVSRKILLNSFSTALDRWSRDEDLYTFIVERSLSLLAKKGSFGMILPLSLAFSTKKPFTLLRQFVQIQKGQWWYSHFDRIPSALFGSDVRTRCTIAVFSRKTQTANQSLTTSLYRWTSDYREFLLPSVKYSSLSIDISPAILKVSSQIQADTLNALLLQKRPLSFDLRLSISYTQLANTAPDFPQDCVFIGGTAYNWFPAWREIPETFNADGQPSLPARTIGFKFSNNETANIVFAMLCSSLGYWWWAIASDGFNLKKWLVERFPLSLSLLPEKCRDELAELGEELKNELKQNYVYKDNKGRIGNFFLPACKKQINAIDDTLATHVNFLSHDFFEDVRLFNQSFSRTEVDNSVLEDDQD